jgi:hypothetical protein
MLRDSAAITSSRLFQGREGVNVRTTYRLIAQASSNPRSSFERTSCKSIHVEKSVLRCVLAYLPSLMLLSALAAWPKVKHLGLRTSLC